MNKTNANDHLTNAHFQLKKALVVAQDQANAFDEKPSRFNMDEWLDSCAWRNCMIIDMIVDLSKEVDAALDCLLKANENDDQANAS